MSEFKFRGSFAEVYDRYLVPMDFAPHGRRLAENVASLASRHVLDTGAGTGVVTRELARILPSDRYNTREKQTPLCRLSEWLQSDLESELGELVDKPLGLGVDRAPIEMVGAKIPVFGAVL